MTSANVDKNEILRYAGSLLFTINGNCVVVNRNKVWNFLLRFLAMTKVFSGHHRERRGKPCLEVPLGLC